MASESTCMTHRIDVFCSQCSDCLEENNPNIIAIIGSVQRVTKWLLLHDSYSCSRTQAALVDEDKIRLYTVVQRYVRAATLIPELRGAVLCLVLEYTSLCGVGVATDAQKRAVGAWHDKTVANRAGSTYGFSSAGTGPRGPPQLLGSGGQRCMVIETRPDGSMALLFPVSTDCTAGGVAGVLAATDPGCQFFAGAVDNFVMTNSAGEAAAVIECVQRALDGQGFAALDVLPPATQTASPPSTPMITRVGGGTGVFLAAADAADAASGVQQSLGLVARVLDYGGALLWAPEEPDVGGQAK